MRANIPALQISPHQEETMNKLFTPEHQAQANKSKELSRTSGASLWSTSHEGSQHVFSSFSNGSFVSR
jgi:hypothetical protein